MSIHFRADQGGCVQEIAVVSSAYAAAAISLSAGAPVISRGSTLGGFILDVYTSNEYPVETWRLWESTTISLMTNEKPHAPRVFYKENLKNYLKDHDAKQLASFVNREPAESLLSLVEIAGAPIVLNGNMTKELNAISATTDCKILQVQRFASGVLRIWWACSPSREKTFDYVQAERASLKRAYLLQIIGKNGEMLPRGALYHNLFLYHWDLFLQAHKKGAHSLLESGSQLLPCYNILTQLSLKSSSPLKIQKMYPLVNLFIGKEDAKYQIYQNQLYLEMKEEKFLLGNVANFEKTSTIWANSFLYNWISLHYNDADPLWRRSVCVISTKRDSDVNLLLQTLSQNAIPCYHSSHEESVAIDLIKGWDIVVTLGKNQKMQLFYKNLHIQSAQIQEIKKVWMDTSVYY